MWDRVLHIGERLPELVELYFDDLASNQTLWIKRTNMPGKVVYRVILDIITGHVQLFYARCCLEVGHFPKT